MKRATRTARSRARRQPAPAPRGLVAAPRVYQGVYSVDRNGLVTVLATPARAR